MKRDYLAEALFRSHKLVLFHNLPYQVHEIDSVLKLMDYFDFDRPMDFSQINFKKKIAQENGAIGVIFKINSLEYPELLSKNANNWFVYRSKDIAAINRLIGTYQGIFAKQSAIDSLMGLNTNKMDN